MMRTIERSTRPGAVVYWHSTVKIREAWFVEWLPATELYKIPFSCAAHRAFLLDHYTLSASHYRVFKQYYALQRTLYWPQIIEDIGRTLQDCCDCCMERVHSRKKVKTLKLFPSKKPLESGAIDTLGSLTNLRDYKHILVITCRLSNMIRTVPLKPIKAINVDKTFFDHWVQCFGTQLSIHAENDTKYTSMLLSFIRNLLCIKNLYTIKYHPQRNSQAESFDRTLLASLSAYYQRTSKVLDGVL